MQIPRQCPPDHESHRGQTMHHRGIKPCGAVRDPAVAVFAGLCDLDEGRQTAQGAVFGAMRGPQCQRCTKDHFARADQIPCRQSDGIRLSGQGRAVHHCGGFSYAVHRRTGPCGQCDPVVRHQHGDIHGFAPCRGQAGGARQLQRRQLCCGRTRRRPRAVFKIPPHQQEKRERQRGIKPCMRPAGRKGFIKRCRSGQQDRQRNGDIHVHPPRPQGPPCRGNERYRRKCEGGQCYGGRDPVEHHPCHIPCPRPDRDRDCHHIHHRKARHRSTGQKAPPRVVIGGAQGGRV